MSDAPSAAGRIEFGTDLDGAIRRWGGYAGFADGFSQVRRVLEVVEPVLGPVVSCYLLDTGRYVAVRLAAMPSTNAITINVGYIWVTPSTVVTAAKAGVDVLASLRAAGLDLHDGDEEGKTVWNAQGRQGVSRVREDATPRRLCPNCFLQWPGDTCPDCDVALMPSAER